MSANPKLHRVSQFLSARNYYKSSLAYCLVVAFVLAFTRIKVGA